MTAVASAFSSVAPLWRAASRGRVTAVAALAALAALPFLLSLPFLDEPLYGDEGVYAVMARGMLDGQLPYRDLFDNKPPLHYAWYALSFFVFGEHAWAPRLVAALAFSATALLVFAQARMIFERRTAYVAAASFGLFAGFGPLNANSTSETLMILPLTASLVAFTVGVRRGSARWLLLAGALGGVAVMSKPVAVWNLAALFAFALLWARGSQLRGWSALRPAAALAAGAAVVGVLVVAPFVATGALGDFLDANVRFNLQYTDELSLLGRVLRLGIRGLIFFPMVAGPFVLAAALGALMLWRRRRWPMDQLLLVWTGGSILGVVTPGFLFPHYLVQLYPALALLTAAAFEHWAPTFHAAGRRRTALALAAVLTLLTAATLAISVPAYAAQTLEDAHIARGGDGPRVYRENLSPEIAAYVAARTSADETIYVFGPETSIYFYADRDPAARYFYTTPLRVRSDLGAVDETIAALAEARPAYIVDAFIPSTHPDWELGYVTDASPKLHPPAFEALLAEQYEFDRAMYFTRIYRLRERE